MFKGIPFRAGSGVVHAGGNDGSWAVNEVACETLKRIIFQNRRIDVACRAHVYHNNKRRGIFSWFHR